MDPKRAIILDEMLRSKKKPKKKLNSYRNIIQALLTDLFRQPWLGFHVQQCLLFQPSWTGYTVTKLIPRTCWRITVRYKREYAGW